MQGRGYGVLGKAKNLEKRLLAYISSTAAEEKGTLGSNFTPVKQVLKQLKFL